MSRASDVRWATNPRLTRPARRLYTLLDDGRPHPWQIIVDDLTRSILDDPDSRTRVRKLASGRAGEDADVFAATQIARDMLWDRTRIRPGHRTILTTDGPARRPVSVGFADANLARVWTETNPRPTIHDSRTRRGNQIPPADLAGFDEDTGFRGSPLRHVDEVLFTTRRPVTADVIAALIPEWAWKGPGRDRIRVMCPARRGVELKETITRRWRETVGGGNDLVDVRLRQLRPWRDLGEIPEPFLIALVDHYRPICWGWIRKRLGAEIRDARIDRLDVRSELDFVLLEIVTRYDPIRAAFGPHVVGKSAAMIADWLKGGCGTSRHGSENLRKVTEAEATIRARQAVRDVTLQDLADEMHVDLTIAGRMREHAHRIDRMRSAYSIEAFADAESDGHPVHLARTPDLVVLADEARRRAVDHLRLAVDRIPVDGGSPDPAALASVWLGVFDPDEDLAGQVPENPLTGRVAEARRDVKCCAT